MVLQRHHSISMGSCPIQASSSRGSVPTKPIGPQGIPIQAFLRLRHRRGSSISGLDRRGHDQTPSGQSSRAGNLGLAGEHPSMPKMCFESLIYDDRSMNAAATALVPDLANEVLVAAREVLVAVWTESSIDAERVHQALIDLLQAAVDAGQPDGTSLEHGDCSQGGP
jgi:hypothetical protein